MTRTLERSPERARTPVGWTREQVNALQDMGLLDPEARFEIIDGEVYEMSDNPPHRLGVILLHAYLVGLFTALRAYSQAAVQMSVTDPAKNNPIPDASVTKESAEFYRGRFPGPDDLIFVAEVSDSTLHYDLGEKMRLYAKAGIPEYWVLDLTTRRLFVHRHPVLDGYKVEVFGEEAEVATLAYPEAKIRVGELLPERDPA